MRERTIGILTVAAGRLRAGDNPVQALEYALHTLSSAPATEHEAIRAYAKAFRAVAQQGGAQ